MESEFVSQDLTGASPAPQLRIDSEQSAIEQLQVLEQHQPSMESQVVEQSLETGSSLAAPLAGTSQDVQFQTSQAPTSAQGSSFTDAFSTVNVNASSTPSNYETSSYKEVQGRLNSLWSDKMREIENISEEHWKSQEFPLARIKKIMRMDEDVKMISTEVPVMFSKILEIFITELTMRSWLHTEESKRRTVQRSDIAMAITKNDMFDFLIDIVPREEIQLKTKSQKDGGLGESLQLLPPDLLQLYIQQVINQTLASITAGSGGGEGGEEGEEDPTTSAITLQQLQLLQQLVQLQHAQQEQQGGGAGQLQHVDQNAAATAADSAEQYVAGGGVDVQVLQSSVSPPIPTPATPSSSAQQQTVVLEAPTVGSALDQLAKNSSNNNASTGVVPERLHDFSYSQQTLHHVTPPSSSSSSVDLHHAHQQATLSQQQQQAAAAIFTSTHEPGITTVVIPQPLDSPLQPQSQPSMPPAPGPAPPASMLDSSSPFRHHHHGHAPQRDENLHSQLESLATEQFISHQLPVELSSTVPSNPGDAGNGGGDAGTDIVRGREGGGGATTRGVEFRPIPESGPISGSMSPITALSPNTERLTGVVFPTSKTY